MVSGLRPGGASQLTILVVDGDPGLRAMARQELSGAWRVEGVATAAEALQRCRQRCPDVLLCAASLPDGKGINLCGLVRAMPGGAAVDVVVLAPETADDITVDRAFSAGASDVVVGPPRWALLRNHIARRASQRRPKPGLTRMGGELVSALIEHARDGILSFDTSGTILSVNPAVRALLGLDGRDVELVGRSVFEFFRQPVGQAGQSHGLRSGEARALRADGRELPVTIAVSEFDHRDLRRRIAIVHDISEHKRVQAMLERAAFYDHLTGVANRSLFHDRLRHALQRARREPDDSTMALLFIDIDNFKGINDRYGHRAGDRVLVEVARRLVRCMRRADTVGRLGGDEFVVILERVRGPEQAAGVAARILEAIAEEVELDAVPIRPGASIGIALDTGGASSAEELLERADQAMYRIKRNGKGGLAIHDGDAEEDDWDPDLEAEPMHASPDSLCQSSGVHDGVSLHDPGL